MTTVAYRNGVIACDSCWSNGGTVDTLSTKIARLSGGALFGAAGQFDDRPLLALLDKVKTPAQMPSYDALSAIRGDMLALVVLPKGRIFKVSTSLEAPGNWDEAPAVWEITGPFAAIGSGEQLALAAMECGKSARDAVRVACKYDVNSRLPVHVLPLKGTDKRAQ